MDQPGRVVAVEIRIDQLARRVDEIPEGVSLASQSILPGCASTRELGPDLEEAKGESASGNIRRGSAPVLCTDLLAESRDGRQNRLRNALERLGLSLNGGHEIMNSARPKLPLQAMAKHGIRRLKGLEGIERPAIACLWPTVRGESVVLDVIGFELMRDLEAGGCPGSGREPHR